MPIETSLGLSQKLEECEQIAHIYAQQSNDISMQSHYMAIAGALSELKGAHTGSKVYAAIVLRFLE